MDHFGESIQSNTPMRILLYLRIYMMDFTISKLDDVAIRMKHKNTVLSQSSYKDFAINIYENLPSLSPKIKVVVGPFVHSMPEYSKCNPGPGFEAGVWWDSLPGDQRPFDGCCLIYNSDPVNKTIEIVGFVKVSLLVIKTIQNKIE